MAVLPIASVASFLQQLLDPDRQVAQPTAGGVVSGIAVAAASSIAS
jgi:hypothetical protein